ncbi:LolA family protein [Nitrosomonas ureae]|uniref:Outer membrane lipoprotein-sorting protein n=1 Tax=Nitrosomonas ureae TaxID=44577 RepID=A0A286AGP9_9PROT|nr:sigma-E factor regulatory protein RseB domain-containing protein [Nitrosomonas ureae]SOD21083.1 Outer membrane lipoprotein-sorting protein [Nitrosomonas ureae]
MLPGIILTMALFIPDSTNPIQSAADHYQHVDTYQATIKSTHSKQPDNPDMIRYYFKKPGHVRIEIIAPVFKGAVLIYSPSSGKVKLWVLGHSKFPSFSLSPENKVIQNPSGQRIDRSDLGALYKNIMALQDHGRTTVIGQESIAGETALHLTVEAERGFSVNDIARFQLRLDITTGFPLKVISYKADGSWIEQVEMSDYRINPVFPPDLFDQ